jgi:hypothetical protein
MTLSFKFPFLLHELFSLTALHLAFLHSSNPILSQKYIHAATLHHTKCIGELRSEIQNIRGESADACCVCASLLGLHYQLMPGGQGANLFFAGDGTGVAWYKLHRGSSDVLKSASRWIEEGGVFFNMIQPWMILKFQTIDAPLERVQSAKLDHIASCWTEADLSTGDKLALEDALQDLRYIFTLVSMKGIGISAAAATLSWTMTISRRFCEMIEERCPQALILVAVYCVLWKRDDKYWWIKGKAESLLAAVRRELPDTTWDKWLEWPAKKIQSNEKIYNIG